MLRSARGSLHAVLEEEIEERERERGGGGAVGWTILDMS